MHSSQKSDLQHLARRCALGILLTGLAWLPCSGADQTRLTPEETRSFQKEALLIMEYLDGYHYADRPFSDTSAKEILRVHLDALDPAHLVFLRQDVDFIHRRFERNLKTVYLYKGDLNPAFEIWDLFVRRIRQRREWVEKRLSQDLGPRPESLGLETPATPEDWPASPEEADERWRRELLRNLAMEGIEGWPEKEALAATRRRYDDLFSRVATATPTQVRASFLNSLLESFDPHSGYFSRETARDFEADMQTAERSTGVRVTERKGILRLAPPLPASPADFCPELRPGDALLAVSRDADCPAPQKPLRREEALALLAAPGEGPLWLRVRSAASSAEQVLRLEQKPVEHLENRCQGMLIKLPGQEAPLACLRIPAFYGSGTTLPGSADLVSDMKELLFLFKEAGARGLVIDLRDNGGGLLLQAARAAGLFVKKGPVLLTRGSDRKVQVHADNDATAFYSGPLVILINANSASASEALAGTLQEMGLALVLGHSPSYGKGSSQDFIDMRQLASGTLSPLQDQWGVMRVTRQLFFYSTGHSPQLQGVVPDLMLEAPWSTDMRSERSNTHALKNESITEVPGLEPAENALAESLRRELLDRSAARRERREDLDYFTHYSELRRRLREVKAGDTADSLTSERRRRAEERAQLRETWKRTPAGLWEASLVSPPSIVGIQELHSKSLVSLSMADGKPRANRLLGNTFYPSSRWTGLHYARSVLDLDLDSSLFHAERLATRWNQSGAPALNADGMKTLLEGIRRRVRLEQDEFQGLGDGKDYFAEPQAPEKLQTGLELLLCEISRIDEEASLTVLMMDPLFREAIRLSNDWADAK